MGKGMIFFCIVTPCVGVWIETSQASIAGKGVCVTPCVGVWIETLLAVEV